MRKEDFVIDLAALMHELDSMIPDVLNYSERYLILPKTLGDLDKQKCLLEIYDRIQKIKLARDLVDSRQITYADYCAKKTDVLSMTRRI